MEFNNNNKYDNYNDLNIVSNQEEKISIRINLKEKKRNIKYSRKTLRYEKQFDSIKIPQEKEMINSQESSNMTTQNDNYKIVIKFPQEQIKAKKSQEERKAKKLQK